LHQQNPPVLNWRCRLTQVDLNNGRKTVVVFVFPSFWRLLFSIIVSLSEIVFFNKCLMIYLLVTINEQKMTERWYGGCVAVVILRTCRQVLTVSGLPATCFAVATSTAPRTSLLRFAVFAARCSSSKHRPRPSCSYSSSSSSSQGRN